jgi:hypothetical protein
VVFGTKVSIVSMVTVVIICTKVINIPLVAMVIFVPRLSKFLW